MMSRVRERVAAGLGVVALVLSGCGSTPDAPVPPSPVAPSITVVTVPGLSSTGTGQAGSGTGQGGVISVVPHTSETAADDGTVTAPDPPAAPSSRATLSGGDTTIPTSQAVSPRTPVAPHEPEAPTRPSTSTAPPTGPTAVAVDLASCIGCTVIGVAADVRPGLAASLATAPQGAVLLATRTDGTVVGVINVPYGVTFPAPAGGALPCDRSGRCFVTARQSQGNSVISVFRLAAGGRWIDVTASGGFVSATATALVRDVDGDGLLDIAAQARAGGALRWVIYHWAGDRFAVLGCAAGSQPMPDGADLSLAACS